MTNEESDLLDKFVKISGHTKQDYIINRLLVRDIVVKGNSRTIKALKDQLSAVLEELKRIEKYSDENEELLILISQINDTINSLNKD